MYIHDLCQNVCYILWKLLYLSSRYSSYEKATHKADCAQQNKITGKRHAVFYLFKHGHWRPARGNEFNIYEILPNISILRFLLCLADRMIWLSNT